MNDYRPECIISGGQTGIDQLCLEVAHSLGILTSGTAPKGYMTEEGPNERLRPPKDSPNIPPVSTRPVPVPTYNSLTAR